MKERNKNRETERKKKTFDEETESKTMRYK